MPEHTSPFLSFVEARHEILKCNLRIGVHELTFIKLSSAAATAILLQFAKLNKLPDAGTARLMQEIVDGPLLDADKKQIVSAINTSSLKMLARPLFANPCSIVSTSSTTFQQTIGQ